MSVAGPTVVDHLDALAQMADRILCPPGTELEQPERRARLEHVAGEAEPLGDAECVFGVRSARRVVPSAGRKPRERDEDPRLVVDGARERESARPPPRAPPRLAVQRPERISSTPKAAEGVRQRGECVRGASLGHQSGKDWPRAVVFLDRREQHPEIDGGLRLDPAFQTIQGAQHEPPPHLHIAGVGLRETDSNIRVKVGERVPGASERSTSCATSTAWPRSNAQR